MRQLAAKSALAARTADWNYAFETLDQRLLLAADTACSQSTAALVATTPTASSITTAATQAATGQISIASVTRWLPILLHAGDRAGPRPAQHHARHREEGRGSTARSAVSILRTS